MQSSTPETKTKVTREQAVKSLWKKGVLHWKLDPNQKDMYNLSTNSPHSIVVIGSARQLGKSYFLCTLAIETCLKQPNVIVKYVAPKLKDVKRIIAPLIREIIADAPKDCRPHYRTQEFIFRFPNGSEIQLAGTDKGNAESIRGNAAHLCIIDEAGLCDQLDYIVKSILIPTTTTTKGKIIMASTPPKSIDHEFMQFVRKAELEGALIKKTIYDNPRLKPEDIKRLADASGGFDSVDFKREYLVELITSIDDAVIPEFTAELKKEIVKEWPRPPHFDCYVAMDIGFKDLTAIVFGYFDFANNKVIIEDELIFEGNQLVTDTLAKEIKRKEEKLWTSPSGSFKPPFLRIADNNNLILLNDLVSKHNINFLPVHKDTIEASLNHLRLLLKNQQIIINPNCVTLINHLETAIWNKARTSFARSSDKGHFDTIDALRYLLRAINYNKNPYPEGYDLIAGKTYFEQSTQKTKGFEEKLSEQFKIRNPRFIKRY